MNRSIPLSLSLATQLARRRVGSTRYLAVAAGATITVALSVLVGLSSFLHIAADKADARRFGPVSSPGCIVGRIRGDVAGEKQYERIVLVRSATVGCENPLPPPGLSRFPEPGEVFVSPALVALAQRDTTMAARFPRIDGEIQRDGLLGSNRVIAGGDQQVITPNAGWAPFDSFGLRSDWIGTYLRTPLSALWTLGVLFCVPATLWLVFAATRVNARVRGRQLSILTVLGLAPRRRRALVVTDTTTAVAIGAVIGLTLSAVVLPRITPTFAGLRGFAGDYGLSSQTLMLIAGLATSLGFTTSVLATVWRPRSRHRHATMRGTVGRIATATAAVLATLAALASPAVRDIAYIDVAGPFLIIAALIATLPLACVIISRRMSEQPSSLFEIVGSRLKHPSSAALNAALGVAVGVFLISVAEARESSAAENVAAIAAPYEAGATRVLTVVGPNQEALAILDRLEALRGTDSTPDAPRLVGTCKALQQIAPDVQTCPAGIIYVSGPMGNSPIPNSGAAGPITRINSEDVRAEALFGATIDLTPNAETPPEPDRVVVGLPSQTMATVYESLLAVDPSVYLYISGQVEGSGAAELNELLDMIRWGGYYSVVAAVLAAGVAATGLAYDRRRARRFLDVIGMPPGPGLAATGLEVGLPAAVATGLAVVSAWMWGIAASFQRGSAPPPFVPLLLLGVGAVAAQFVLCTVADLVARREAVIRQTRSRVRAGGWRGRKLDLSG